MIEANYILPIIAHALIGFYFAFFGFWNIYHWRPILVVMNEKNIPLPQFILSIGIAVQVTAGFLIMFSSVMKLSAFILLPFTIIAVCMFHPFWNYKGEHRVLNFTIFSINMTVTIGALLLLMSSNS
jgi:putative oxidoreductase